MFPVQIASAMIKGDLEEDQAGLKSGAMEGGQDKGTLAAVEASLIYLRDRVSERQAPIIARPVEN